ncbi:hypothetical protein Poli38472_006150 [Pythium oligandrum]|uniref:Bromo domain-containing protein n=1 Tax=Pythium oligandrum TaxID=41045 RepID=A0A8K1CTT9_PYTOL|nr:hypothetical protein Poli38472_006150 [Pythium oligandrum]|eukprot:TMW68682.1 hypothetical protein Poli38472_006150 [Pythium oligandrum]
MDTDTKKKCNDVLDHFLKLDSSEPFRERVNWEEWGLYDYLQIVKTPMDLGTIRTKLGKNEYKKASEFARDMRLVWDNCKLYNQDGSDLYMLADDLSKKFEDKVKSLKLDVGPRPDRSIPAPSTDEKIEVSLNIYKIASKDLAALVDLLEEQCPKALDKSSPDELEIVIDSIDNKTFRDVHKFVLDKVPEGAREAVVTPKSSKKSKRSKESSSSGSAKKAKTGD